MRPERFPEANGTLGGGPAAHYGTENDVGDLPVHRGAGQVISCWSLTWLERLSLLLRGRVWLIVLGGNHAPVCVQVEKPFAPEASK